MLRIYKKSGFILPSFLTIFRKIVEKNGFAILLKFKKTDLMQKKGIVSVARWWLSFYAQFLKLLFATFSLT
ncbi:MAG: hypothetical protein LPK19_02690, partial [Hymenobacteraceae bacterium]|nr:hypothetical protein [Hymenobacteraceae bacterium]MDX5395091.1 hypothetical protein [Hymenobacteraceae bacterium]MDX5511129.1 hypothetical protein [Hymenobacteraceae bacterium]